jgi:hypothetical protein
MVVTSTPKFQHAVKSVLLNIKNRFRKLLKNPEFSLSGSFSRNKHISDVDFTTTFAGEHLTVTLIQNVIDALSAIPGIAVGYVSFYYLDYKYYHDIVCELVGVPITTSPEDLYSFLQKHMFRFNPKYLKIYPSFAKHLVDVNTTFALFLFYSYKHSNVNFDMGFVLRNTEISVEEEERSGTRRHWRYDMIIRDLSKGNMYWAVYQYLMLHKRRKEAKALESKYGYYTQLMHDIKSYLYLNRLHGTDSKIVHKTFESLNHDVKQHVPHLSSITDVQVLSNTLLDECNAKVEQTSAFKELKRHKEFRKILTLSMSSYVTKTANQKN